MISLLRLKGRALYIGNATLSSLIFFTALLIVITSNLLPVIYVRGLSSFVGRVSAEYVGVINFSVSAVMLLLIFALYGSITSGIKRYFLKKAQKRNPRAEDIFYYFRPGRFFVCFWYCLRIKLLRTALLLFCLFPSIVCMGIVSRFSLTGVSALVCMALTFTTILLLINGVFFYLRFSASFFLCDYYFVCGEYLSFRHLVASSQRMMKDKSKILFRLRMSFAGWFLLCTLILSIPFVWSYYSHCLAVTADTFMGDTV